MAVETRRRAASPARTDVLFTWVVGAVPEAAAASKCSKSYACEKDSNKLDTNAMRALSLLLCPVSSLLAKGAIS